jgi:hypothetical protein
MKVRSRFSYYCSFAVVAILTACQPTVYGQWSAGLEAGADWNKLLTNTENEPTWSYVNGTSFSVGVPVRYAFSRHFSVAGDPQFLQKNYQINYNRDRVGPLYETVKNGYIQLPLSLAYSLQYKGVMVIVEGGGFGGYWLHRHVDESTLGVFTPLYSEINVAIDQTDSLNSATDRRLEGGWQVGGQFGYAVSDRVYVFAAYRFCQSLTSQQKNYMADEISRYNRTSSLTFRAMYQFSTSKRGRK